jgi:hypothetical protein
MYQHRLTLRRAFRLVKRGVIVRGVKTEQVIAYVIKCSRCGFESPPCPTKQHAETAAREDWGFRGRTKPVCGGCRAGTVVRACGPGNIAPFLAFLDELKKRHLTLRQSCRKVSV